MAGTHKKFWKRHPGLVWCNPEASDAVRIRVALLRPRFDRLLAIALEFGTARVKAEWTELLDEKTDEVHRAGNSVRRILANIEKGFGRAASRN
jgi:hypothetical protein